MSDLVELSGGLEEGRAAWSRLAPLTRNIFSTWEWAEVWWRHFGRGRRLRVMAVSEGDDVIAILPLARERRAGIPLLRFLGHGVADQLGPVCAPQDVPLAAERLGQLARASVLLAERLPGGHDWQEYLGGEIMKVDRSPVIDLASPGSWDAYLMAGSANFRQQIRRRARRLDGLGVRFRLTSSAAELERDFDTLVRLHHARWGRQSRAFALPRARFHRDFALRALENGWLRLWLAEADGVPVAAWYGFRFEQAESFYQSGRDPAWDRSQVGAGLLELSIREAFEDGMDEYRLLRGDERYKSRYATVDPGLHTVAAAPGAAGSLLISVAARLASYAAIRRAVGRGMDIRPGRSGPRARSPAF